MENAVELAEMDILRRAVSNYASATGSLFTLHEYAALTPHLTFYLTLSFGLYV